MGPKVNGQTLSFRTKVGFGVCDLGGNLFFTVMGFYLLYYLTDVVGVPAYLAGTALMIGKVWDAITDPLVGTLSDRTRTRWGRRKPWMTAGAFFLFGGMLLMFRKPSFQGAWVLFLWATGVYCFLNTAYTFVSVPYGALTPELSQDYHEQATLNGYRQFFAIGGTFLGAGIVLPLVRVGKAPAEGWFLAGAVLGGVMLLSSLLTVVLVGKERVIGKGREDIAGTGGAEATCGSGSFWRQTGEVLRQKTFLRILVPWTLHISGVTLIQNAMVYYFQYIYGNKEGFQIALMVLLTVALLCIPLWIRLSRRVGKREVYNAGMLIFAATILFFFFAGHRMAMNQAFLVMVPAGIGFSVQYAMPFAILPDVVEWDYAEFGTRREGIYYGLWTFSSKMGQSLAFLSSGWVLALFGYIPQAASQPSSALWGIRLLTGVLPAALFILGAWVHRKYPIDPETYRQVLEKTRLREEGRLR